MKRTKIVATLGPATNSVEKIKELIANGMDAARVNFSHGTYESHTVLINNLKQAREELGAPIPLLLDTKGPEIRIKQFKEEYSFAGDRLGHSYIRIFYPKEMHVGKYKLKVINDKGEEKKLRAVMSFKRTLKFIVFDKNEIEYLNITYLRKSKIIICFNLIEDIDKIPSKRKKDEIEKAINFINNAI